MTPKNCCPPAQRQAESGDHLVEHQQGADPVAQAAQTREESRLRHQGTLHRLDDDGGEAVRNGLDEADCGFEVVVRRDQHRAAHRGRNAGRVRMGRGIIRGARGLEAVQRVIVVAVISALELEQQVAAGEGPRQAQGIERGIGAAAGQLDRFGAGHELRDSLGKTGRDVVHRVIGGAARGLLLDGRNDARMGVADQHRSGAEDEIDELAAIGGPQAGASPAGDDDGEIVGQLEGTEAIARNHIGRCGGAKVGHDLSLGFRGRATQAPSARSGSSRRETP